MLDALKEMGGPTQNADLKHINVIEVDEHKNASKVSKVDLQSFAEHGNTKGNPLLKPGLVIFVPDKKKSSHFGAIDLIAPITILRGLQSLLGF